jgi:arylsulfatase A-like enzyme
MIDDLDVGTLQVALNPPPPTVSWMTSCATLFGTDSTTFISDFVSLSLRCPSRAAFLTGEFSHNSGVEGDGGTHGGCQGLRRFLHPRGSRPTPRRTTTRG